MNLKEIQKLLSQSPQGPQSAHEALRELKACVERALAYLDEGHTAKTQDYLERGFGNMMAALHFMNLDLEQVVNREQARRKAPPAEDRVILIFSDHAELRVAGELRGTIPLYCDEDYDQLREISQLFQCRMEHAGALQLDLFNALGRTSSHAPASPQ